MAEDDPWTAGTFAGAERAQRQRVSRWTPQERLAWLEAAVLEAYRSGAVAASRRRKQAEIDRLWSSPPPSEPPA